MGMDPPGQNEIQEITVELEGPVDQVAFDTFRNQLKAFIANAKQIANPPPPGGKLKVRVTKAHNMPKH